jgi:uncharacterized protein (UPF0264 family)
MSQLLVSVRNLVEALQARKAGADFVDLKEPAGGSLAAVEPQVRRQVAEAWGQLAPASQRPPLSAALGELMTLRDCEWTPGQWQNLTEFRYVKVGLAGTASQRNWSRKWLELQQLLPANCKLVAAAYADAGAANAPDPCDVLELAVTHEVEIFLLDTWDKSPGNVFTQMDWARLRELREMAQGKCLFVLAGSLRPENESLLRQLQPDIVAVRGAVCEGGRNGKLCDLRLAQWRALADRC